MRTFENVKVKDCYSIQTVEVSDKLLVSFSVFLHICSVSFCPADYKRFFTNTRPTYFTTLTVHVNLVVVTV